MRVERGRFCDVSDEPAKLSRRRRPLDGKIAHLGESVFDLLDSTFDRLPSIGPPFISPLCSLEPFEQLHIDLLGTAERRGPLRVWEKCAAR